MLITVIIIKKPIKIGNFVICLIKLILYRYLKSQLQFSLLEITVKFMLTKYAPLNVQSMRFYTGRKRYFENLEDHEKRFKREDFNSLGMYCGEKYIT